LAATKLPVIFPSTLERAQSRNTETEEAMAHLDLNGDRASPETLLMLGIACASSTDPDRVNAHKWFNLAATRGNEEAARCRHELAMEMSPAEVIAAQRAAREWLRKH
jgi:TPR repeat protein